MPNRTLQDQLWCCFILGLPRPTKNDVALPQPWEQTNLGLNYMKKSVSKSQTFHNVTAAQALVNATGHPQAYNTLTQSTN